jgi:hypothetical protein
MSAGDGVLIEDGKAVLTAGPSCQMKALGPQTSVVAGIVEGCGCVWISQKTAAPVGDGGTIGAIAGVAGIAAYVASQKQEPLSP